MEEDHLSDVDTPEHLIADEEHLLDILIMHLEQLNNSINKLVQLVSNIGSEKDSLTIRKQIKEEKQFAFSVSKELHELIYSTPNIYENHYKILLNKLNKLFKDVKQLEEQYPEKNLQKKQEEKKVNVTSSWPFIPLRKRNKQESNKHSENNHDLSEQKHQDYEEIMKRIEEVEEGDEKDSNALLTGSINNETLEIPNQQQTDLQQTSLKQYGIGTATAIGLGLVVGGIIGGPVGVYVGGKIGASVVSTVGIGSSVGMILGGATSLVANSFKGKKEEEQKKEE